MKRADLSRARPTEADLDNHALLLNCETDRGLAVMAAALVENALEVCIRARLADPGQDISNAWFQGLNAPFASFAAKIKLGRALAIYGPAMEKRLSTIKDVRNAFAHSAIPLGFTHAAITTACATLYPVVQRQPEGGCLWGLMW